MRVSREQHVDTTFGGRTQECEMKMGEIEDLFFFLFLERKGDG